MEEKITINDMKKEIKRQFREKKKGKRRDYNFLGFIENDELTNEVKNLFKFVTSTGYAYYDWVNGNKEMLTLIQKIEMGKVKQEKKQGNKNEQKRKSNTEI